MAGYFVSLVLCICVTLVTWASAGAGNVAWDSSGDSPSNEGGVWKKIEDFFIYHPEKAYAILGACGIILLLVVVLSIFICYRCCCRRRSRLCFHSEGCSSVLCRGKCFKNPVVESRGMIIMPSLTKDTRKGYANVDFGENSSKMVDEPLPSNDQTSRENADKASAKGKCFDMENPVVENLGMETTPLLTKDTPKGYANVDFGENSRKEVDEPLVSSAQTSRENADKASAKVTVNSGTSGKKRIKIGRAFGRKNKRDKRKRRRTLEIHMEIPSPHDIKADHSHRGTHHNRVRRQKGPGRQGLSLSNRVRGVADKLQKGKELGRGAFGYVCQMLNKRGHEVCVGKYFHPTMIRDKHFGTKFTKEALILGKLSHPNIVEYVGSLTPQDGGEYCLLEERMAYSLHDYVYKMIPNQLLLSVKLFILLNVANGLSYLHSQSPAIIHRDLTAHNVLLTADNPPIAKIADFGNCRFVSFESSSQLKSLSEKPGTPHYMAPEACREHGDPRYNTKLDIFSFGNLALFTFIQSTISSLLPIVDMGPDGRYDIRTEIDRRQDHFEKLTLPSTHPAVIMMKTCLSQKPEDRPDACTLVASLEDMHKTATAEEADGVAEGVGALSLGGSEACGPDVPEPSTSDPNHGWGSERVRLS